MLWEQIDLSKCMIAAAPFGGPLGMRPIQTLVFFLTTMREENLSTRSRCQPDLFFLPPSALARDDRKVLLLQKQQPAKPSINLYTSSGKRMEPIQVQHNFG